MLVPSSLRLPAPVNQGVRLQPYCHTACIFNGQNMSNQLFVLGMEDHLKKILATLSISLFCTHSFGGSGQPSWYHLAIGATSFNIGIDFCKTRYPQYHAANEIAYRNSIFSAVDYEKIFRFLVTKEERVNYQPKLLQALKDKFTKDLSETPPESLICNAKILLVALSKCRMH